MKLSALFWGVLFSSLCLNATAQVEPVKANLDSIEYVVKDAKGKVTSSASTKSKFFGRHILVTYYNVAEKFDSVTVMAEQPFLDSLKTLFNQHIEWLHPDGKMTHSTPGKGDLTVSFYNRAPLRVEKITMGEGVRQIQEAIKNYVTGHRPDRSMTLIPGAISEEVVWQDGSDGFSYYPRKGKQARRYKLGNDEVLVIRNAKTGNVTDVYVRERDNCFADIENGRMAVLAGVYENETGKAVFGKVQDPDNRYNDNDPGSDIRFLHRYHDHNRFLSDTIEWGFNRIQRVKVPPGAPRGWGGAAAFSGPSTWVIKFTDDGLAVKEIGQGVNRPTYPAFGKDFKIRKIRSPYLHSADSWAVVSEEPMLRGHLKEMSVKMLRTMLSQLSHRHKLGSPLSDLEKVNKSLIETIIAEKTPKRKK